VNRWGEKLLLVPASLWLAACSAATAPLDPPLDDAIAHVQISDPLSSLARVQMGVPVAPLKLPGRARCPFVASSARFECAAETSGTLTHRRSYQLVGEDGAPVGAWTSSVASIRFVSDISGRLATAAGVIDVQRHDESTLGDLRELRQTLSGFASVTWSDGQSTWSGERRTELLVMSRSRMPGAFPVGTIELSASRLAPATNRHASLRFDGSPFVSMLVSVDGGASIRCTIDLQAPEDPGSCQ
jgi:hypothetical protein